MTEKRPEDRLMALKTIAVVVGLGICYLGYVVAEPILKGDNSAEVAAGKVQIPPLNYHEWQALPVQHGGRVKPFESAAAEIVRNITGREKFEKTAPSALVLQWMMLQGKGDGSAFVNWDKYPFILCDHYGLRAEIYTDPDEPGASLTNEQLHGKYVSPADLHSSSGFAKRLAEAREIRGKDSEKAQQLMSPEQRKAEEVAGRLELYESITQTQSNTMGRMRTAEDPVSVVALDHAKGSGWFSLGNLRAFKAEPERWRQEMKERLSRTPQLYINPERRKKLEEFQIALGKGTAEPLLDELVERMRQRTEDRVKELEDQNKKGLLQSAHMGKDIDVGALIRKQRQIWTEQDKAVIADLRNALPANPAKYRDADPQYFMLHLNYLENYYPDLYPNSAAWQTFPVAEADGILNQFAGLQKLYGENDPARFDQASAGYFNSLREVSEKVGPYPGTDTPWDRLRSVAGLSSPSAPGRGLLDLEMIFDRVQPFQWAWVSMLASLLLFVASLALAGRVWYLLGFAAYFVSLGVQLFGFYCRVVLAARPPVSNMYETVVWVAFMSAIFALVLELIYRRRVIALAGAAVATLGLILADQLPLVLDPKISPLTPVLRSNYWLTIHVLTIVSSYAGGTLAWGLANVALGLLAFGRPRQDVLKLLSKFIYRAMQIAVLLLAAGTFLGGWWAAESWGRFWGWDPKEVWALIALVCYVIPLHMRYIGWVKDFGLAVAAILCYAAIVMSWYGVNFVLGAGLHSYGFGGGGPWWVFLAGLINIEYLLIASILYYRKLQGAAVVQSRVEEELAPV